MLQWIIYCRRWLYIWWGYCSNWGEHPLCGQWWDVSLLTGAWGFWLGRMMEGGWMVRDTWPRSVVVLFKRKLVKFEHSFLCLVQICDQIGGCALKKPTSCRTIVSSSIKYGEFWIVWEGDWKFTRLGGSHFRQPCGKETPNCDYCIY